MQTVIRVAIITAGLASGSIFASPAACASGNAPWCALTQLGEGAQAWDCHYGTVQECAPVVTAGNRAHAEPYYSAPPATASVPGNGTTNTTAGANRKSQKAVMATAIQTAVVVAGLAIGSIFGAAATHAASDAPWCAVVNLGMGDARWDCRYRSVEECVPHVIAGDRGSCSPNPHGSEFGGADSSKAASPTFLATS